MSARNHFTTRLLTVSPLLLPSLLLFLPISSSAFAFSLSVALFFLSSLVLFFSKAVFGLPLFRKYRHWSLLTCFLSPMTGWKNLGKDLARVIWLAKLVTPDQPPMAKVRVWLISLCEGVGIRNKAAPIGTTLKSQFSESRGRSSWKSSVGERKL